MNQNNVQRTNGCTSWPSNTSVNYTGPTYFNNNASQQTQSYNVSTFTIGNRVYGGNNVPVFTSTVRNNNGSK
jgi:hypothetical protein